MIRSRVRVFDVKRFAIHDGAGIRTTVFLKGCPLRCAWCQNPEGLIPQQQVVYFKDRCIHCQLCHVTQPQKIDYTDRPIFAADDDLSEAVKVCPANALSYDSEDWEICDLVDKIKEDEVFFKEGGGVTFSGGEPFMQADALKKLLHLCHQEGIHTAIETSLYTSWDHIRDVLNDLDFMYCDLKLFDDARHIAATGVSNQIILDHIRRLLTSSFYQKMIVRTPLIPGYNADDDNIAKIAEFLSDCQPNVRYELLNYNPLASAKYELTDFTYGPDVNAKAYSDDEMNHFRQVVQDHGILNIVK